MAEQYRAPGDADDENHSKAMSEPSRPESRAPGTPDRAPERFASGNPLLVVFVTILIDFVGFSVLIPVLPLYADQLGANGFEVSLMLALYALAQLLFLPAWGWASDRYGRRPVLLISLLGTTGSFILLAGASSLALIYVSRILGGFFAASIGTAQAVVTDVTPPAERAEGMGRIGAAFGLAMVIGPAMGGLLVELGQQVPFYAVAGLAGLNFVLAWWRLPETRAVGAEPVGEQSDADLRALGIALIPTPLRLLGAVHDRRVGLYLYLFFHMFTAFAALEATFTLFLGLRFDATPAQAGLIFAWIGLFIAFTQGWLVGRIARSVRESTLVAVGLALTALGLAAIVVVPSMVWFYVVGPLVAVGNGLAFPTFTSLYSQACETEEAGELLGQSQAMATTGRVVGGMSAGLLMDSFSLAAPFLVAAVWMALALVIFLAARRMLVGDDAPHLVVPERFVP